MVIAYHPTKDMLQL